MPASFVRVLTSPSIVLSTSVTMPNGNDDSLITKMHATFQDKLKSKFYDKVRMACAILPV